MLMVYNEYFQFKNGYTVVRNCGGKERVIEIHPPEGGRNIETKTYADDDDFVNLLFEVKNQG